MSDAAKVLEYQQAVRTAVFAARMLQPHDLAGLIQAIDRADALGPLLDPTAWRERHQAMLEDREILEAALPLWRLGQRLAAGKS
jgi:hypothetical protein